MVCNAPSLSYYKNLIPSLNYPNHLLLYYEYSLLSSDPKDLCPSNYIHTYNATLISN